LKRKFKHCYLPILLQEGKENTRYISITAQAGKHDLETNQYYKFSFDLAKSKSEDESKIYLKLLIEKIEKQKLVRLLVLSV